MEYLSSLKPIWRYRSTVIFVSAPIIAMALPLAVPGKEALCGYCMILMGIYWVTEVIPLAVTSLIPLILFPLFGIMTADNVSRAYFNKTNWLFVGGLTIAVAVETTNLHKRIALRVLTLLGAKPHCLLFGFMSTTFFLSMWISNTATTAMMLPIVAAVIKELAEDREDREYDKIKKKDFVDPTVNAEISTQLPKSSVHNNEAESDEQDNIKSSTFSSSCSPIAPETDSILYEVMEDEQKKKEVLLNIQKALILCVPYSASIGGTVTVTGTGPNLILSGQFPILFPGSSINLNFGNWFVYCFPSGMVFFLGSYVWMTIFFLGFNFREMTACLRRHQEIPQEEANANALLQREYKNLGPIKWSEKTVLVVFVITAFLWFFRKPGFMPGWSEIFEVGYVEDGTIAVGMASILFFLPETKPMFLNRGKSDTLSHPVPPILKWSDMQKLFPWNVVVLLGGGFALAKGATASGFSQWLGNTLNAFAGMQPWLICLIITIILCVFTEFTSNIATASLFVPILATLASTIRIHPIYLMFPPILASSMAFMLPVATPPNAIAFAYGHVQVIDMMKAGSLLNVIGVITVTLFINTYGVAFFGLNKFPTWANTTTVV